MRRSRPQLIGIFRGSLNNLYGWVSVARTATPCGLENDHAQRLDGSLGTVAAFQRTFGPLPAAGDVHQQEWNMIDVDDELAIDKLMTLKIGTLR